MYLGRIALGRIDREGKEYYPEADWQTALPHYKKALDLGIEKVGDGFYYAHTLEHLGYAYLRAGQYEEAKKMYLQKIERFPNFFFGDQNHRSTFWPRFLTAEMDFQRFNSPTEAYSLLQPITDPANADPANIYRVYLLASRLSTYFEDWEKAEKYAKLALDEMPADIENYNLILAHGTLAVVNGQKKDFAAAEAEIKNINAIAVSPLNNCILANAYYFGKDYTKAITIAKAVTKPATQPYLYSLCLRALVKSSLALEKKEDAKKYLEEYMTFTDAFSEKNIFTARDRAEFAQKLQGL